MHLLLRLIAPAAGADSVLPGCAAAAGGVQVKGKGWMDTFMWKP
jgi:hypothetical protein